MKALPNMTIPHAVPCACPADGGNSCGTAAAGASLFDAVVMNPPFANNQDIGHDPANPLTRLYATSAAQPFHNDASDLVALLCLKNARSGGLSSWSSSVSVHNEILRRAAAYFASSTLPK